MALKEISTPELTWIHITKSGKKESNALSERFNFVPEDLRDVLPPIQRSKLVERENYLFLILLFPVFNRATKEINLTELDLFLGPKFLVSVNHGNDIETVKSLFETTQKDDALRAKLFKNTATLLHEMLSRELNSLFSMLIHISNDIDNVEKRLFAHHNETVAVEILRIKTNIVNFRRAMQTQPVNIEKLLAKAPAYFSIEKLQDYLSGLLAHTKEVWTTLDGFKETIDALAQTSEALVSFRVNKIIKILTLISVISLPPTLISFIFGMNTKNMPIVGSPQDFWIIIGAMTLGTAAVTILFKKKKWL